MSDFSAKFLREGRKFFPKRPKRAIHLAAFGKHPGWDDHMDDLGLETETLLLAKQVLYAEGIGGLINSGEWEKLGESERLPGFKHVFVWKRGEAFLLGRMWASRDGKRREKYPMVLCAQCDGVPLSEALLDAMPILETCEQACKIAKSPDEVKTAIVQARDQLRLRLAEPEPATSSRELQESAFVEKLAALSDDEGLFRILYHLRTQMPYNLVSPDGNGEWQSRAGQIRLPVAPDLPMEALSYWLCCLERHFGQKVPILMLMPLSEPWLDAVIGRPAARDFFCLRATSQAVPIASNVAHEIDATFHEENAAAVQTMRSVNVASAPAPEDSKSGKNWLEKILSKV